MHTIAEIGTNVPAFLGKLWKMVEDPVTNDFITWSSSGTSFVIKDEIRFARELLPMYYKHNNMASFIRQLNMYGFHKIVSPEAGSMKLESDEIQFSHPFFVRGHAYLLDNIKRKIGVSKVVPDQLGGKSPQVLTKVLTDVRQMKGRQESMDSRLTAMKLENGALWRELSVLRQKHIKQQQIVNKLIQFLVTVVHQNHNSFSVKRKFPRMLQHHGKPSGKHLHPDDADDRASDQSHSPSGPIIHELDPAEALLESVVEESGPVSPSAVTNYFLDPTIEEGNEEVVVDVDLTGSLDTETIIGIPEDTLRSNRIEKPRACSPVNNRNCSQTSPTASAQNIIKNVAEVKPKIVKIVRKLPKEVEAQPLVQQTQTEQPVQNIQRQIKKNLQKQIQVHQQQIEVNKEQIKNQKKLQKNNQQLKRSRQQQQQQQIQNNQHQIQRTQQQIQRTQQQIRRNQQQQIQRQQEFRRNEQQQLQNNQLPELLVPKKEPEPQTDAVITIPFNNGETAVVAGLEDVEPLCAEPTGADYSMPILVEVPAAEAPAEPLPSHAYTSDLLLGSPLVLADPVMTPASDPVDTPLVSSPSPSPAGSANRSNMQVACVDDTQANSSNIVTRSALLGEMDNHLENVQSDLDNLKELLRSEGISLDANALLTYFNDDPLSFNISDSLGGDDPNRPKESNGSELMAYNNPSLFDFTDLLNTEWSLPPSPGDAAASDDTLSFTDLNTPQCVPLSPSFPQPAKKRKK